MEIGRQFIRNFTVVHEQNTVRRREIGKAYGHRIVCYIVSSDIEQPCQFVECANENGICAFPCDGAQYFVPFFLETFSAVFCRINKCFVGRYFWSLFPDFVERCEIRFEKKAFRREKCFQTFAFGVRASRPVDGDCGSGRQRTGQPVL